MPFTRSILVSAFLAILLIGCKKAETPPTPTTSDSVAAPPSSLPPSDGNLSPAPSGTTSSSGNAADTPTQAQPKDLSKLEETTQMPLPGQVNNHSTVDPIEKK